MLAALDFATRAAICVGLILAAAWLAVQALQLVLRRRGSVWYVAHPARARRVLEMQALAVCSAVLFGALAGWLGRALGIPFLLGWAIAAAAAVWSTWRVAEGFRQTVLM